MAFDDAPTPTHVSNQMHPTKSILVVSSLGAERGHSHAGPIQGGNDGQKLQYVQLRWPPLLWGLCPVPGVPRIHQGHGHPAGHEADAQGGWRQGDGVQHQGTGTPQQQNAVIHNMSRLLLLLMTTRQYRLFKLKTFYYPHQKLIPEEVQVMDKSADHYRQGKDSTTPQ